MFGHDEHDYVSPYEWAKKAGAAASKKTRGSSAAPDYTRADGVPYAAAHAAHARVTDKAKARAARYAQDPAFRHAAGLSGTGAMGAWPGGIFGAFGADVPYTTNRGATGTAHTSSQMGCGSPFGVQQMLVDLGYPVVVDGQIGPETMAALDHFASDYEGSGYVHGTIPQGQTCMALDQAWLAKMQPGSPATPPSPQAPPNDPNATGIWERLQNWWHTAPTTTKVLVVGGSGVVVVLGAMALTGPSHASRVSHATPNGRRRRKRLSR